MVTTHAFTLLTFKNIIYNHFRVSFTRYVHILTNRKGQNQIQKEDQKLKATYYKGQNFVIRICCDEPKRLLLFGPLCIDKKIFDQPD